MVETLVNRACRRLMLQTSLGAGLAAVAVVLFGFALLLAAGTRWLNWWELGILGLSTALFAVVRITRSAPSRYAAASELDRAAELSDTLSTALFFADRTSIFAEAQRREAERIARGVDLPAALPLKMPRSIYSAALAAVAAGTLLAARLSSTGHLDLRAPITQVFFEDQAARRAGDKTIDAREALRKKNLESAESLLAKMGVPLDPEAGQNPEFSEHAPDHALSPDGARAAEKSDGKTDGAQTAAPDKPKPGDPIGDKPNGDAKGEKNGTAEQANPSTSNGDKQSLLSKLKDAVSNMLSSAGSKRDGEGKKASQQNQAAKGQKGKPEKSSGAKQQQGEDAADSQDSGDQAQGKEAQDSESKSASSKSSQQSGQSGSGAGNQDGQKELRAAAQLKAMGKISEILGKRAKDISGETMMEVQSGNQHLSTAYSGKTAAHGESAGDVSRDEIPVELQPYVREYFERVRKAAPAKTVR